MSKLRVSKQKTAKGKKKLSPQEAFAKLWKQVQTEQQLVAQIPRQIEAFYQVYQAELGSVEVEWCRLQEAEIRLLLSHWGRKSLRERDRLFLARYVLENFTELKSNPFRDFDLEGLEEMIKSVLAPGEDFDDIDEDQDPFEDLFADLKAGAATQEAGEDNILGDFDDEALDEFDACFARAQQQERQDANEIFNATTLNKMFRQLSKVLHPDLEQDEALKQHKHELMSQLLVARDKHDVGAIMGLYAEHIGGDGAQFSQEDFPRLTILLKKQLRELQFEKQQVALQSGLPGLIFQHFHHKNPARQKNLLQQRQAMVMSRCADLEHSLAYNTTVKNLKRYLDEWADEEMGFMLDELFENY